MQDEIKNMHSMLRLCEFLFERRKKSLFEFITFLGLPALNDKKS